MTTAKGRALVSLDFDGDGDLDFVESRAGARPIVYRNDGGAEAGGHLRVRLRGRESMTSGRGARVAARVEGDASWLVREVGQASFFLGHSELVAHFGLGTHAGPVDEVRVCWPVSGRMQKLSAVEPGALTLDENDADIELNGQPCASAIVDPNL